MRIQDQKDPVNVLLVDDQPAKLLSYEVMLSDLGETLVPVSSAQEALAFLLKSEVAVILVDVCMPELDGFELAKMIREHPRFQKTAIIFVSAVHMSESDYLRGYEAGAVDYLSVPVVPELLRAKVRVFAELFRKSRQLQKLNEELEARVAERTAALESAAAGLRQSEQDRSLALAAGRMGSWGCDIATGSWFWDEGQSHIFGVEHGAFTPTVDKILSAVHPDDVERLCATINCLAPGRETFNIELRIVRPDGDTRWCQVAAAASLDEKGSLVRVNGVTTDITFRKEAEDRQALLAREVDHRAKNALAIVQAILRLARKDSIDEYVRAVEGRINALAQTHELLSNARWEGADVLQLVLEELAPYNDGIQRVTAVGPAVLVSPENAQVIAIALHELATNAAKYGGLSTQSGRVDISWSILENDLTLRWMESGGPKVEIPKRKGFGTKIISSSFAGSHGRAVFDWRPEGLCCELQLRCDAKLIAPLPLTSASSMGPSKESAKAAGETFGKTRLLLVEDEPIVAMFMEALLDELGFEHSGAVADLATAIKCATSDKFGGAVLDMNLRGETIYPVAEILEKRGIPFLFVTGYAQSAIQQRFSHVPVVHKPVTSETLRPILLSQFGIPMPVSTIEPRSSTVAV